SCIIKEKIEGEPSVHIFITASAGVIFHLSAMAWIDNLWISLFFFDDISSLEASAVRAVILSLIPLMILSLSSGWLNLLRMASAPPSLTQAGTKPAESPVRDAA